MATAQTASKLASEFFIKSFDVDPNGTGSTAVGWVAAKGYDRFGVMAFASALTGNGVTAFSIQGATAAAGTNATVIKSHAVGSAPDAVGDQLFLEVTEEEINAVGKAAGYNFTHISAYVTMQNSADENVVTYIFRGKRQFDGQTSDIVA